MTAKGRRKLPPQLVESITTGFYSQFCGMDLSGAAAGTHFVCTRERDKALKGLGCKYTIYIFVRGDLCIASFSPKHRAVFEPLAACGVGEVISAVSQRFLLKRMQLMMFERETVTEYGRAKILEAADYPLYETFFRRANPNAAPDGWLKEYFMEKAEKEYLTGYLSGDRLLSVCDAPDMPYLEDKIQHTGIQTLREERRKGYAACTAALAAHHLLEMGVCPQWECRAENSASIALARSIGYKEYGMAYVLAEQA